MAVSEARRAGVLETPLHPFLMLIPATCLTGGLLTDVAYWSTVNTMWADFSAWVVSAGAVLAWAVALAGISEALIRWTSLRGRPGFLTYTLAYLAAMVFATFNMLVHSRDGWLSVVPWGIALSTLTVVSFLAAASAAYVLNSRSNSIGVSR